MLPVSADHQHTPNVQYPVNNPPYVPNVTVLPEVSQLLVPASAYVANESGLISGTSNARMYCYNLLASAGWANNAFAEVVKLACDNAALKSRMTGAVASAVLMDAVREALSLYTSSLIVQTPELANMMPREHVQGASNNMLILNDLNQAIASMYAQPVHYQAQSARIAAGHVPQHTNHRQSPQGHRGHVGPVTQPHTNKAIAGVVAPANRPEKNSRYATPGSMKATEEVAVPLPSTDHLVSGEIEKMDRDAHSIVYFGQKYDIPTPPLRRRLEESVENHEAVADTEAGLDSPFITQAWVAEASLDEMLAVTRAKRAALRNSDLSVYLSFGLVVTPIITDRPLEKLFGELSNSGSFADISRILTKHLEGITEKSELRAAVNYVAQLDRHLTRILNDYLNNSLPERLSTTSFIEDAPEMTRYLNDKFKGSANQSYVEYQRRVMGHLFQHTYAAGGDDPVTQVTDYDEGAYWDNLAVSYSITHINATANELGYNVDRKTKEVDDVNTPLLARLIKAIQRTQAKDRAVPTSHHLIVTSDDARYVLFQTCNGKFTLREL